HEFGHFFYDLPDEYVSWNDHRGGRTGICADTYVDNSMLMTPEESDGVICDEQHFQAECDESSPCLYKWECTGTGDNEGIDCKEEGDDGCPGGVCLGGNSDRDDKIDDSNDDHVKRICKAETSLSMGTDDVVDEVCLMRGSDPYRRRWCDRSNHVYRIPAGATY
ncbi:MAG: hypothetical protein GTN89_02310, partial [Acidobacteria bacterium]|nr:hypothetical protein [Acidobacteriota bacterium]NIM61784.1 hypothetical protein [Acidobacteriota bacterium]NIO60028.1 hypothetical protein [Acidobacteriota bacterium]NIQ29220.1 hypothetical protein [Acidobacteriota bacterium]NIQ83794.1 hypothetical protein [Acidobacteriota bacterium]